MATKVLIEVSAEHLGAERHEDNAGAEVDSPEKKSCHVEATRQARAGSTFTTRSQQGDAASARAHAVVAGSRVEHSALIKRHVQRQADA
jgi:hypothetical protein